MPEDMIDFTETNDVYMQMLWDAKKLEDQRLVRMIRERMKRKATLPVPVEAAEPMGDVIPLPCPTGMMLDSDEEFRFWKESQFWQEFLPFMAIFSLWICWFLFFMTLLARDITRG